MFARVTTIQGPPERIDEAARGLEERAVPFVRQLSGFKGAYWLADRQTGKVLSVAIWESEEVMRANETVVEQRRRETTQALGATIEDTAEYEVIAHA